MNKSPEKIVGNGNNFFLKAWLQKVARKNCYRNEYYPYIKNLIYQNKFILSDKSPFSLQYQYYYQYLIIVNCFRNERFALPIWNKCSN